MKYNKYAITFCDDPESIIIYAFTIEEARILAQAKKIEKCQNWRDIYNITEL